MKTKTISKEKKSIKNPTCFPSEWFNGMPTPIFILDQNGKVLYANDSFCDLIKQRKKTMSDSKTHGHDD